MVKEQMQCHNGEKKSKSVFPLSKPLSDFKTAWSVVWFKCIGLVIVPQEGAEVAA